MIIPKALKLPRKLKKELKKNTEMYCPLMRGMFIGSKNYFIAKQPDQRRLYFKRVYKFKDYHTFDSFCNWLCIQRNNMAHTPQSIT